MQVGVADAGSSCRRYGGVPLDTVGALLFEIRQQSSEFRLLGFTVCVKHLDNEVKRVYAAYFGQFVHSLSVIESLDDLKQFCFLF